MFCRCWTPHQEFNGCRFHIWASLDSLFSWMLGGGIRCTSRMGSICGVDPQDLTRLAGRMFVAVPAHQATLGPCRMGFVRLELDTEGKSLLLGTSPCAQGWVLLLFSLFPSCSLFLGWQHSSSSYCSLCPGAQVLFSGSCSHYTRCCWGLAPLPLRDFCALLSLFVLRPLSDAFSLANTFS